MDSNINELFDQTCLTSRGRNASCDAQRPIALVQHCGMNGAQVKRNKDMAQRQYDVKKCEDAGKLFGDDSCRHAGLLKYFGERPSCQNCGSCAAWLVIDFLVPAANRMNSLAASQTAAALRMCVAANCSG